MLTSSSISVLGRDTGLVRYDQVSASHCTFVGVEVAIRTCIKVPSEEQRPQQCLSVDGMLPEGNQLPSIVGLIFLRVVLPKDYLVTSGPFYLNHLLLYFNGAAEVVGVVDKRSPGSPSIGPVRRIELGMMASGSYILYGSVPLSHSDR